jgi:hypothetical protein
MPRSIVAVVAGLLTALLLMVLGTRAAAVVSGVAPDAAPTDVHLALGLAATAIAAIIAGYVAARIAPRAPLLHAAGLAVLLLLLAILGGRAPGQPSWYPWVLALLGAGGALLGARLCRPHPDVGPPGHRRWADL